MSVRCYGYGTASVRTWLKLDVTRLCWTDRDAATAMRLSMRLSETPTMDRKNEQSADSRLSTDLPHYSVRHHEIRHILTTTPMGWTQSLVPFSAPAASQSGTHCLQPSQVGATQDGRAKSSTDTKPSQAHHPAVHAPIRNAATKSRPVRRRGATLPRQMDFFALVHLAMSAAAVNFHLACA